MTDKKDCRLNNQKKYLKSITLVRRSYRQYAKTPNWDHDHCDFCWENFTLKECEDSIRKGYATVDDYYWICPTCFEDFKDMFNWKVINAPTPENVALPVAQADVEAARRKWCFLYLESSWSHLYFM